MSRKEANCIFKGFVHWSMEIQFKSGYESGLLSDFLLNYLLRIVLRMCTKVKCQEKSSMYITRMWNPCFQFPERRKQFEKFNI